MSWCGNIRHREKPDTCRLGYHQGPLRRRETEKATGELQLRPLIRRRVVLMRLRFDSARNQIASLKQQLENYRVD